MLDLGRQLARRPRTGATEVSSDEQNHHSGPLVGWRSTMRRQATTRPGRLELEAAHAPRRSRARADAGRRPTHGPRSGDARSGARRRTYWRSPSRASPSPSPSCWSESQPLVRVPAAGPSPSRWSESRVPPGWHVGLGPPCCSRATTRPRGSTPRPRCRGSRARTRRPRSAVSVKVTSVPASCSMS